METSAPAPVPAKNAPPKFVRWAVMLGIVITLNIFFYVASTLIFPQVNYEDFCPINQPSPATESACTQMGGVWNPVPMPDKTAPQAPSGFCDLTSKCQKPYEAAMQQHQMWVFTFMVGAGVLSLIIGVLPIGSSIVSSGLSYGGVLAFIIGSVQYWSQAGNWLRLAIATVALIALIYIGIRRFRD